MFVLAAALKVGAFGPHKSGARANFSISVLIGDHFNAEVAGDSVTSFVAGADKVDVSSGTTTGTALSRTAGSWNLSTAGVYVITGSALNFVKDAINASTVANAIGAPKFDTKSRKALIGIGHPSKRSTTKDSVVGRRRVFSL